MRHGSHASIALLAVVLLAFGLLPVGCWAKKPACAIIKVANDVCMVLEYQGEDGQIYRVRLTEAELEELAAQKAAQEGKPAPQK